MRKLLLLGAVLLSGCSANRFECYQTNNLHEVYAEYGISSNDLEKIENFTHKNDIGASNYSGASFRCERKDK